MTNKLPDEEELETVDQTSLDRYLHNDVPFLIEPPRFFEFLPNRDIEKHTPNINGLNQQLTVDVRELQDRTIAKFINRWIRYRTR